MNVEIKATIIDNPKINIIEGIPNTNKETLFNILAKLLLIILQITCPPKIEIIKQIPTIIKDSIINILNTSIPLAPKALNIPISLFLLLIETEIKLNNSKVAKKVKMTPIHKNIVDVEKMKLSVVSNDSIIGEINL